MGHHMQFAQQNKIENILLKLTIDLLIFISCGRGGGGGILIKEYDI